MSIAGEDGLALASAFGCEPREMASGTPSLLTSGAAIVEPHDIQGYWLGGICPLTEPEWQRAWDELNVAGTVTEGEADAGFPAEDETP